jgi:D-alanine-D-alanine ligase-like ATP-grasp enzyme
LAAGTDIELLCDELETIDWTDRLHSSWVEVAVQACHRLGVDVGGVDLRGPAEDFETPCEQARPGTGLLEVNVLPALHVHALPTQGQPRPVFEAFVAYCLSLPDAPDPQPGPQL